MSLTDLPSHILDDVASHITTPDGRLLHSLALVCRAFRLPSQKYIFRSVTIHIRPNPFYDHSTVPPLFLRLKSVFTENSALIKYVQTITFVQMDPAVRRVSPNQLGGGVRHWLVDHGAVLADILDILHSAPIHTCWLLNIPTKQQLVWSDLPPRLRSSLLRTFHKCQKLGFDGISLPQNIFSQCYSLSYLLLSKFSWLPRHDLGTALSAPLPQPRRLKVTFHIDQRWDDTKTLGSQAGVDLSKIDFLFLSFISTQTAPIISIPPLPTLKNVILSNSSYEQPQQFFIDLSQSRALNELTFFCEDLYPYPDGFQWLHRTLHSIPSAISSLSTINIIVNITAVPLDSVTSEVLERFSAPLAQTHERCKSLRRIVFGIKTPLASLYPLESVKAIRGVIEEIITWDGCRDVLVFEIPSSLSYPQ
ncbi:hypothetical protein BDN72DRAFT_961475 [Pluteus cervinus]|uniref:Uncharacterized protein n=1 Tax=Pluteus cervinus TaxID=181527 RepID=A0ACD3ALP1_9AGAR|nr:hypothetical protein BDN72DRAFT_961475 [Pluteus cervinus]